MGLLHIEEAEASFIEAVEAAATAADERVKLTAAVALLSYRVGQELDVDLDAALEQARRALDWSERVGDDLGIARACRLLASVYFRRGELGPGAAVLEQGVEAGLHAGDVLRRIDLPNLVYSRGVRTLSHTGRSLLFPGVLPGRRLPTLEHGAAGLSSSTFG